MRFMMILKASARSEAGLPPNPELIAAIGKHAEKLKNSGALLEAGGLLPSSAGTRVRVAGQKVFVTDGPFTETRELVGGYAIFQLNSKEEAVRLGKEFMQLHADVLGPTYDGELEIRQIDEGIR